MHSVDGSSPVETSQSAGVVAPREPPLAHYAVLDESGVIVAADDRWALAAHDPDATIGVLGSVGTRYHDECEAAARQRPDLREPLLRLATTVRNALADAGSAAFAFELGRRTQVARVIPVRGAGDDRTVVTLVDTTGYPAATDLEPLVDALDAGILLKDPEGRVLVSNASAQRILGLTAEQLAGTAPVDPRWAVLHEDGWPLPTEERPSRIALRTRRPLRDALVGVKRPDASVTWTSVSAHPLIEKAGERPHAVVVSITDVTESRAAAAAEHRSHDRFRSLIEHSSDVVTIVDDCGRVTYESPAVEAVLGYAPGELVGPGRLARVHPDDLGAAVSAVTGLIGKPGESVSCEYRIRARDERWRVLESVATNRLHDPAVLGIVVNTRDVTERRETEAALRATTTRLENLVQNLQAGVLVEDEARRIVVVNSDLCTAFSIDAPPEALLGGDCVEAAHAAAPLMAEPERFVARIEELIAAREPVHGEEVAFADGRTFERAYIPISSGRLDRGHLWIYRDISRRKDDEREASRLRDEAIRASRLKSEFLATMSHEIRTPMNGVLATVELLLDTPLEPHQRDLAVMMRDASHGLLSVVNDALDLSKIEAEKLEPREVDFDLTSVAEGVADVVLSAARRKRLDLSVYVDPRIPQRLRGDAQWLRQVLVNLAGNAVKFTDDGEVRIRAELEAQAGRSATVRFAVSDTGLGIPLSDRERLFEPFVQLEAPGGGRRGGTGLGLAICQRLVGLMGGELEVESRQGQGATFFFSLTMPGSEPPVSVPAGTLRVLIVEPRCDVAETAAEYLGARGIETQRVASARAAVECAQVAASGGRPFDVAIVGIGPPDRAAEVASALRSAPGCAETTMVLLKDVDAPAAVPEATFARELTRPLKQLRLYEAVLGHRPGAAGDEGEPSLEPLPAGMHVLVAEDNEVNRELLVRQLAKLGVAAEAVGSGRQAVAAVLARSYDAVLMDFHMPGVDGPQAARAIRAIPGERGATPIVAVTASGTPDERGACIAAGMDEFVQKPISSGDLARALHQVLPGPGTAPATEYEPGAPAIDRAVVERLESDLGHAAELRRIAGIFLAQLEPGAQAILASAAEGNSEELRRAAHRLGSASATFGAIRVAELCGRLEALGAAGRARASGDVARALEAERLRAADELRAMLALR